MRWMTVSSPDSLNRIPSSKTRTATTPAAVLLFYENGCDYIYGKSEEMLYLQNTEEAQVLFVPRNCEIPSGDLVFKAKSTIDLATEIDLPVVNLDVSGLYLHLAVTIPEDCPNGEYEYTVLAGDEVVSTGILIIGENSTPEQYNHTIEYDQYEAE